MDKLETLRAVLNQTQQEFGHALSKVLSPSRPLQSEEYLKGRAEQLHGIEKALYAPGRHVLIHGLRGVGKSSLAQTAAFKISKGHDPIIVSCDPQSTFKSIIKDIFDEVLGKDPRIAEELKSKEGSIGFSFKGWSGILKGSAARKEKDIDEPLSVNDAVRIIQFLCQELSGKPVFVVDEFDLIANPDVQRDFANLVKQVSDKHVEACFIFCGIADSAEALMAAHGSADRYFHAVALGKLPWDARIEIVETAAEALGITIDRTTIYRIAMICDGFPYYVHFISEKLFWRVFEAKDGGMVNPELFSLAMEDAAGAMDMKLRGPYEKATQKYDDTYSAILFAVADGHELRKRSSDIFKVYERVMGDLGQKPATRQKFNNRMNRLKSEPHGCILTATRQGWYEFTEKMIRGYVRLKAEQAKVRLSPDHPGAASLMHHRVGD
ncbi:AAA ATPase-like protein [Paracoccus pantotrophus]|uniref:AAA ATPase-like protein n=1 Tax=Paracoccus pantotrophus TaxID=82367 RepID=A0ABX9SEJ3_PARPN|nr:ATP-binding protein [Paracoccus pantotrophus]RKS51356.1 AAA ATPase-like protein [Paracoccus pantotrophus]